MKQSITESGFRGAFRDYGRNDQFSYEALGLLYEFFGQLDEDCGTETELDVIAICCEFSEESWEDIADNFSIDLTADCNDDEKQTTVMEYLWDNTSVVGESKAGIIYQSF